MKRGQAIIDRNPKSQVPNPKEIPSAKSQNRAGSFSVDAREDKVQLLCFPIKPACFDRKLRLRGGNHAEKILRFFGFLYTAPNRIPKVLLGYAFIRLAIIRADAGSATNQLTDQPIIR